VKFCGRVRSRARSYCVIIRTKRSAILLRPSAPRIDNAVALSHLRRYQFLEEPSEIIIA